LKSNYRLGFLISIISCCFIILCSYKFSFAKIHVCKLLPNYCPGFMANFIIYLPAPEFFHGILAALAREHTQLSLYFMGKMYVGSGHIMYFPTVFLLKTPLPFLLLIFASIAFMIRKRNLPNMAILYPFSAALGILLIAMSSDLNIGIRHVLALYPLMVIFSSIVLYHTENFKAVMLAALVQTLICYDAFPNHFHYYNFLAGKQPEYIANPGNYDIGHKLHLALQSLKNMGIENKTTLISYADSPGNFDYSATTLAVPNGQLLSFHNEPPKEYYLMPKVCYIELSPQDKAYFDSLTRVDFKPELYILFANPQLRPITVH
jgi:hypothetical protein